MARGESSDLTPWGALPIAGNSPRHRAGGDGELPISGAHGDNPWGSVPGEKERVARHRGDAAPSWGRYLARRVGNEKPLWNGGIAETCIFPGARMRVAAGAAAPGAGRGAGPVCQAAGAPQEAALLCQQHAGMPSPFPQLGGQGLEPRFMSGQTHDPGERSLPLWSCRQSVVWKENGIPPLSAFSTPNTRKGAPKSCVPTYGLDQVLQDTQSLAVTRQCST